MVRLTQHPINHAGVVAETSSTAAGAVVLFLGTTRDITGERRTDSLDYECYPEMALRTMSELETQARERWPLLGVTIVHRTGRVLPGEASVAIAVSSAHRKAAFEAGQWLIDSLKESVPIWKRENWADGTQEWVHPGLKQASSPSGETP